MSNYGDARAAAAYAAAVVARAATRAAELAAVVLCVSEASGGRLSPMVVRILIELLINYPAWDPDKFYNTMRTTFFLGDVEDLAIEVHRSWWLVHYENFTPKDALLLVMEARSYVPTKKDHPCPNPETPPPFGYNGDPALWDTLPKKKRREKWRPARIVMGQFPIGVLPVWKFPLRPLKNK